MFESKSLTNSERPSERIFQLERALLELGTELSQMRTEIVALRGTNNHFIEVMKGLKNILDEKGLITCEDFDNAIELGQAIASTRSPAYDFSLEEELNRLKKSSH